MATCPDCGNDNREGAKFCAECGAKLGLAIAVAPAPTSSGVAEDDGLAASFGEEESAFDSGASEDAEASGSEGEPEAEADLTEGQAEPAEEPTEESAGYGAEDTSEAEAEVQEEAPEETPKTGYLVFPDSTEQPIPSSQWLIGRADLAKYLPDQKKANEISRGHLTVFQEGDQYFIEDGTTMVQRKPSANKTWLIRNGSRTLITGTGRTELQDADEIDVAELVKLQFVLK